MYLEDIDMQHLSDTTIKIGLKRGETACNKDVETYYKDYNGLKYYPYTIFEYDFGNARELAQLLSAMWEYQGKEDMKLLIPNCVASTYKYFDRTIRNEKKSEISPFIYEF